MKNLISMLFAVIVLLLAVAAGAIFWVNFHVEKQPEITAPTETIPETTIPETTVPETTVPETTVSETTIPETTVPETTEPPVTEPAWEPVRLTKADFTDPLTDLTDQERHDIYLMQYQGADMYGIPEGEIGQTFPRYANLDLDHDGKPDQFFCTGSGLELRMGNGRVSTLDVDISDLGAGCSAGLIFADINHTGTDDILFVHAAYSTAGTILSLKLFTDAGGRYYHQQIPDYKFYLEDLHNDYVRLSCASFPYREVMLIGGTEVHNYLPEGQSLFDYYFSTRTVNGKVEECKIINVTIDGNQLVVLYDFLSKNGPSISSNPFGVVYRLEPGGYFVIDRMGTEVIRDYWLPVETPPAD